MPTYSYVYSFDGVPVGCYKDPAAAIEKFLSGVSGPIKANFASVAQNPNRKVVGKESALATLVEGYHMTAKNENGYSLFVGRVLNRD